MAIEALGGWGWLVVAAVKVVWDCIPAAVGSLVTWVLTRRRDRG